MQVNEGNLRVRLVSMGLSARLVLTEIIEFVRGSTLSARALTLGFILMMRSFLLR